MKWHANVTRHVQNVYLDLRSTKSG